MIRFGLIGEKLDHSFSARYFTKKFENFERDYRYDNFPLQSAEQLPVLIKDYPDLYGLNVTIPYKEAVMSMLDKVDAAALEAGAVNTITIDRSNGGAFLTGYNTDIDGFTESLFPLLGQEHKHALVLGSGGASKAVVQSLEAMNVNPLVVSRTPSSEQNSYKDLTPPMMDEHKLIINTTPLGMQGLTSEKPPIPYHTLTPFHLLYDLVYNPPETLFLQEGKMRGARTKNGQEMLERQAEHAWEIWQQVIPARHWQ